MSANAQVAPAVLGVNLLATARAREKGKPLPASSGSSLIDDTVLEGGFRYGETTSIAGLNGTGKTLVGALLSVLGHPCTLTSLGSHNPFNEHNSSVTSVT